MLLLLLLLLLAGSVHEPGRVHRADGLQHGRVLLPITVPVGCVSCADDSSLREAFTDAVYFKDEALRAFKLGVLSLEERAEVCVRACWGLAACLDRGAGATRTLRATGCALAV